MKVALSELQESIHHFVSVWKLLARPFPTATVTEKPGLVYSWAGIPFLFYNTIFLTEPVADASVLQSRIAEAATFLRSQPDPGWLVLCRDQLSASAEQQLDAIAEQQQLTPLPMTGMVGDILPLPETVSPELSLVPIADEATITDFVDLNSIAYNLPVQAGRSIVPERTLWNYHAHGFVAYKDKKPVSTATAIVNDGCLLLFLVATAPEFRRRGYADAVIRRALNTAHAATGIRRTILHATDAGAPVYERLGYHRTASFVGHLLQRGA